MRPISRAEIRLSKQQNGATGVGRIQSSGEKKEEETLIFHA